MDASDRRGSTVSCIEEPPASRDALPHSNPDQDRAQE
jgi:hypothetical protein